MRLSAILALLALAAACRTPGPAPEPTRREGILLAVDAYDDGGAGLDAIASLTPGGLRNPWEIESDSAFSARWFAPGTRYAVRVAGVPVGQASVLRRTEPACSERIANASVTLDAPLPAGWAGLASDAFGRPSTRPLARAATAEEQAVLAALADSIHVAHGIAAEALASTESKALFAVTVPGADGPVLVGSFDVTIEEEDGRQSVYTQLLVAERRGRTYRPAFVFHARDDGDVGLRSMLDAADLDGDGVPELVTRAAYNEGWGYTILKCAAAGWTEIYQGGGGGC
jgi:hypothetical protein